MTERKPFLDNIRSATVLLVVVYHVGYLYNGVGIPGGVPGAESLPVVDGLLTVVYPWFMVLLFAVAGICSRYALERRTGRAFIKERSRKLLVPSTLGLFVLHWVTGYLNIWLGGGLELMPGVLVYPISVLSGIGPLWFAQMLWLFSFAPVLLRRLDKKDRLWKLCGKTKFPIVAAMSVLLWRASYAGNVPVLTMYRFGIYFTAFILGYLLLSQERVQQEVQKLWLPLSLVAVGCGAVFAFLHWGTDYTQSAVLQHWFTNLYAWAAVLAILGAAGKWWNRETGLSRYLAKNSFGIYVLHYPVLLIAACLLHYASDLGPLPKYVLTLVTGLAGTLLLNAAIRKIKYLRYAVLGMK